MDDLFAEAADRHRAAFAPLPERVRPRALEDVAGQAALLAPGTALRRAIEEDRVPSSLFHGPPGSGKTTLARVLAAVTSAEFEELSAVNAGKADVQAVIARARDRLGAQGIRTILFIDEIHRFNKAQQDALLPAVESGLVILIGATTENPYHSVNGALLSRLRLFEFEPLATEDIERVVARGVEALGEPEPDQAARAALLTSAGGDARSALQTLEVAHAQARSRGSAAIEEADVLDAARRAPVRYDREGDRHYDTVSAFIKSVRGSDPDAALYYLASMIAGGEDARFIARRLVILASEDIGNAEPNALVLATAAAAAVETVGLPEARYALSQATAYLALAPKSNASALAIGRALADVERVGTATPPDHLRDASYRGAAKLGRGVGYVYPHDHPDAWVDQQYLPDEVAGARYYEPTEHGREARLRERLDELRARRER